MKLNYFLICKMCFSVTYFISSYCRSLILILRSLSRTGFFHLSSLYFGRFLHSATLISSKFNTTNTRNKAWTSFIVRSSKNKAFTEKRSFFTKEVHKLYQGGGESKIDTQIKIWILLKPLTLWKEKSKILPRLD
jgi:hypothetical protein